jgi:GNAT superfamily N-acetyltransferase
MRDIRVRHIYFETETWATIDMMLWPSKNWALMSSIAVRRQGRGAATRLMAQVLEDADREGVTLMLAIEPDYILNPNMDEDRLRNWYKRLGFCPVPGSDTDMKREPRKYEGTGWPKRPDTYCGNPAHGYGEHDQFCMPPADPRSPEIRMIRAIWGLCAWCNRTDMHDHPEVASIFKDVPCCAEGACCCAFNGTCLCSH